MAIVLDSPLLRPVLGTPTPFTGALRIFVPKGKPGYAGDCGGCGHGGGCGSECRDPRLIMFFVNGNHVNTVAYGGSYQAVGEAGDAVILPDGPTAVQWITGATSLESEMECGCNPSQYWDVAAETTTIADLDSHATSENPYAQINRLTLELEKVKGELRRAKADLLAFKTKDPPPAPTPSESFDIFVSGLKC